jgi:hypothetical protein
LKGTKFATIVTLDRDDFCIEIGFNKLFKPKKSNTNFRLCFKRIKPLILDKIINHT